MKKKLTHSEAGRLGAKKTNLILQERKKERIKKYNQNPKRCLCCKKAISYKKRRNKFCSHSCAAICNNLGGRRDGKPREKKICLGCGKKLKNRQQIFCSNWCHGVYKRKQSAKNNFKNSTPQTIRRYLKETRGIQCEICRLKEWQGKPIPLQMHHIDGNYKNNVLNNLKLLCPNCHAQTETFGYKNRGNGRYWRRKRYKEGKSC